MSPLVVIDPGHGYDDPGATIAGVDEATVAREVAVCLREMLEALPVRVMSTRPLEQSQWWPEGVTKTEEKLTLGERATIMANAGADLVLHLHADSSPRADAHGLITYWWPGNLEGRAIASQIMRASSPQLAGIHSMPVMAHDATPWLARVRNVLRTARCTSVLVEMGFLTSEQDRPLLQSKVGQLGIAAACLCGVTRWLEMRA